MRPGQANPLQKRTGNVDSHQRYAVVIQFLQSFDPAATAALALRGVDDLPGLVVLLLQTVARLAEIEDHRHQDREATQVFENFQERPAAQHESDPLEYPVDRQEWNQPGMSQPGTLCLPGFRTVPRCVQYHRSPPSGKNVTTQLLLWRLTALNAEIMP